MVVEAVGPRSVSFQALAAAPGVLGASLTVAGAYLLHVRLAGTPVAGWPRMLHVLAAESEASRCANARHNPTCEPITCIAA